MIYTFEILKSTSAGYADIPAQSVEVVHKEINWNESILLMAVIEWAIRRKSSC